MKATLEKKIDHLEGLVVNLLALVNKEFLSVDGRLNAIDAPLDDIGFKVERIESGLLTTRQDVSRVMTDVAYVRANQKSKFEFDGLLKRLRALELKALSKPKV